MSQVKKLAGETVIYGMGSILPKVLNFLLLAPYLTRILDQENYGIHGILYAYVALLISIYTLRLETAYFRFATSGDHKDNAYESAFTIVLIFSIFVSAIIFVNAEFLAAFITKVEDARYIRWFSIILLLDACSSLPFAKLRLENRPILFSAIKVINVLIAAVMIFLYLSIFPRMESQQLLSGFPFYYSPGRELDYVFLSNLVASLAVLILLIPQLRKVKLTIDKVLLKKMLKYSLPLIIVGVAGAINQVFDRVFISKLIEGANGIASSGIYNGAAKVAVVMSLFATAFNYAAEPFFFKSYKDKDSTVLYAHILKAFVIAGCFVFLGICLFLDQAKYLIGDGYWEGMNIVPVLLMAYLFLGIYYNISIWYKLKDKTFMGAVISIAGAIITIVANILLIPTIGAIGAAWSALICFILMCAMAYFTGKRNLEIPYDIKNIFIYIFGAVILYYFGLKVDGLGINIWLIILIKGSIFIAYVGYAFWKDRTLIKI